MENFKREYFDSGIWQWFLLLIPILLCILVNNGSLSQNTSSTPTSESKYIGDCHRWSEAANWANSVTCIWGYPISTETSLSGVWLHFSERNHPYPDFAAKIDCGKCNEWSYFVTGNNVEEKYSGRCVEIHGWLELEKNSAEGITVDQPIIEVSRPDQITFCD